MKMVYFNEKKFTCGNENEYISKNGKLTSKYQCSKWHTSFQPFDFENKYVFINRDSTKKLFHATNIIPDSK